WGSFIVPAWHTFFALGAIASYYWLIGLARKFSPEIAERDLSLVFISAYIGGYFGARIFSVLIEGPQPDSIVAFFKQMFSFGAMTFYGGLIGAFVSGLSITLWRKLPLLTLSDLA